MASLRSDGKAIEVTVSYDCDKDDPVYAEGFHGIAMEDASSGDTIAIEIAQRVHEITVDAGVTATKGTILYIASDQSITNTNTDKPFGMVVSAKDANNVCWVILLPQYIEAT